MSPLRLLLSTLLATFLANVAVAAPGGPDDSVPAGYALDEVTIWSQRGPAMMTPEINGHAVVHTRLMIRGTDGAVENLMASGRRDTLRQVVRTITDTDLVDLLNEFYRSGFFGYSPNPTRRTGVAVIPGTRQLARTSRTPLITAHVGPCK